MRSVVLFPAVRAMLARIACRAYRVGFDQLHGEIDADVSARDQKGFERRGNAARRIGTTS